MANKVAQSVAVAVLMVTGLGAATARAESPVERGKYRVGIMDCAGCHSTGALTGQPPRPYFTVAMPN